MDIQNSKYGNIYKFYSSLIINTWKILENKQRFKSIIFFGLVSFSIILELLGIGMVFPIIGLIINENFLSTLPF